LDWARAVMLKVNTTSATKTIGLKLTPLVGLGFSA